MKRMSLFIGSEMKRSEEDSMLLSAEVYTCQVSRLRRDCHACGSKTAISRLLTPAFPFLMPSGKVLSHYSLNRLILNKNIQYLK